MISGVPERLGEPCDGRVGHHIVREGSKLVARCGVPKDVRREGLRTCAIVEPADPGETAHVWDGDITEGGVRVDLLDAGFCFEGQADCGNTDLDSLEGISNYNVCLVVSE